jgi:hypothetical protein
MITGCVKLCVFLLSFLRSINNKDNYWLVMQSVTGCSATLDSLDEQRTERASAHALTSQRSQPLKPTSCATGAYSKLDVPLRVMNMVGTVQYRTVGAIAA